MNGNRAMNLIPPPGQLIDIGGYRLHLHAQGEGGPTVVLEAGNGDFSLTWSLVQPEAARLTRVVSYDRAGLGWSDRGPRPRTVDVAMDELRTLLHGAGIPGPYILVGHSYGGMVARLFAYRYPGDVAGLVLVDAAHEDQMERLPESYTRSLGMMRAMMRLLSLGAPLGLDLPAAMRPLPAHLPAGVQAIYEGLRRERRVSFVRALADEFIALPASQNEMRAARDAGLGNIPLRVLSHGVLVERYGFFQGRLGMHCYCLLIRQKINVFPEEAEGLCGVLQGPNVETICNPVNGQKSRFCIAYLR